jgi:uncharacterized RDD family membrane protein YckC
MQDILTDLDHKPVLASIGKRWLACAVDYIIFLVVWTLLQYAFTGLSVHDYDIVVRYLVLVGLLVAFMIPWILIFPGMESFNNGQTIGKALFGIRTVKQDGAPLDFGSSLLRHLFSFVDYFPFLGLIGVIVAANKKEKQRVGDLIAKTIVVEARK